MTPYSKTGFINRSIAAFCALVILLANFTGVVFVSAEDAATTVPISSSEALIAYSREYALGHHNPDDTIQLALSSGTSFVLPSGDDGYIPIGNADRPFNGKLEIADNAGNSFITDVPLFGTVTTAMQTVNASNQLRELEIARLAASDNALFAQNVTNASGSTANWKITLKPDARDTANVNAYSFASVVGTVADSAKVKIEFTHDSVSSGGTPSDVAGSGNVGTICGELGAGAELTFKINSANVFNVTSSGGNAGGVVGSMGNGAKLIADTSFTSVANVTSSGGYAGALAGIAENAEIVLNNGSALTLSKTVSGSSGAGGVYGRYVSTTGNGTGADADVRIFELDGIITDSAFTLSGSGDVGVLAGTLDAENSVRITESSANITDTTFTKQVRFSGGNYRGGLVGRYSNTALTNTLDIHNVEVRVLSNTATATSGGAVGSFYGDSAVYATVDDFRLYASGTAIGGGVIGNAGGAGSFIDVADVDIDGSVASGVVDSLRAGVLRFSGTTDLSGAAYSSAQIVNTRGNGLIYALGSGSDAGWTLKRGSGTVDDVGDWGEVLRVGTANGLAESDFFTVDMTAHTVTVAGHAASMGTVKDFIRTALNIQLNDQDRGALKFSSGSRGSTLLASSLAFTADIDLSGTGIVALTRDNGANAAFTGSLNGGGHTLTLAIGEPYGKSGSTTLAAPANIGANNYGTIIGHQYAGLFAKTENATVTDLVVDGYISLFAYINSGDYKIGGVAAQVSGTTAPITLTDVDTKQDIYLFGQSVSSRTGKLYCGGAIGQIATGAAGTAAISDCVFESSILEKNKDGNTANIFVDAYVGGAIGQVSSVSALTLDFDNIGIGGGYDNCTGGSGGSAGFKTVRYGGLIGVFAANSGSFNRNVTLNNVSVNDGFAAAIRVRDSGAFGGGFLGSEWPDVNVTVGTDGSADGITIGSTAAGAGPSVTWKQANSVVPSVGALVGKGTGHWVVNHVKVNKATLNAVDPCTFGFIVNDGTNGTSSAIYLDLVSDGYDVANTAFSGTFNSFDEVVRNTVVGDNRIDGNGNGIVSIRTANGAPLIMTGSGCNTYQNQTAYGKNTVRTNDKTRYYYNLDLIRAKGSSVSAAEKLLLWSLNKYAHSSIRKSGNTDAYGRYFNNAYSNTISGNCDMTGLSYYPVEASGVTINNATVKFYNEEIEDGEALSGGDGIARSTHVVSSAETQHYLMHQGLFLDYTGTLTVNRLTLEGNVGLDEGDSGFLIRRTFGGSELTSRATINNVTLEGARISDRSSGDYSPLLINNIGKNVKLDISNLSATAGSGADAYHSPTTPAASSLIGDVGNETATNINISFSGVTLDARSANGGLSGLDTAYGTSRSIFDRATLLNSFRFLNGSLAEYNYEYSEDWTSSQHHVTYGKEVKDSVEYAGREDHYYNDASHYTHPTDSTGASAYNFSSGFLPYVYTAYDAVNGYHEVKVNVKDESLTTGCGQYNDPYIITDGAMLVTAANIIAGSPASGVEIALPTNVGVTGGANALDMWCDNKNTHSVYTYTGGSFVNNSNSSDTKSLEDVRVFLAGAYYSISTDVTLPDGFVGFGGGLTGWTDSADYTCQYAFRGVITGNRNTITNNSRNPLIKIANGCVLKDVTIAVEATIPISSSTSGDSAKFRYDTASCANYGAAIGQVMGGDNVIDHVEVDFTNASFSITNNNPDCNRIVPVGGYIGVVVNGGVIFRNMTSDIDTTGLTAAKCPQVADSESDSVLSAGWLYVNPIIGRVIAGYAFNETSSYAVNSAKVNNGTKNYAIPDLNPASTSKLLVNASARTSYTVEIPDAQTFFIFSCIVNSGAGSATYGASETAYPDLDGTPWSGYRSYTSTRCAKYDEVGTNASSSDDYDIVAAQDAYTGVKTPYIISQYTSSTTLKRARSVCGNSATNGKSTVSEIKLTGSSYNLPAGFRGIGSIYSNDMALYILFNKFNGNGKTVNLSMSYQEYNHESGKEENKTNTQVENYKPYAGSGFGMINAAYLNGFDASSDTNSVKDLTLTGSVFYDIRKLADPRDFSYSSYPNAVRNYAGSPILCAYGWHNWSSLTGYYPDPADRLEAADIMHTGGVTGTSVNSIYYKNVTLSGLSVEGPKYTGGYIGYITSKSLVADAPSASGLTVKGGMAAGGLVGGFGANYKALKVGNVTSNYYNGTDVANADLTIKGSSGATAVIGLTDVQVKGYPGPAKLKDESKDSEYFRNIYICAGGLVGYANIGTSYTATVQYVTVSGGTVSASHRMHRPSDMRYKIPTGGLFGRLENAKVAFSDISVSGVGINGVVCGGLIGLARYALNGTIEHVSVSGGTNLEINSTTMAGGLIGYYRYTNGVNLDLDDITVENYTVISSVNDAEKASAGGMIGSFYSNGGTKFNITNSVIRNVTVSRCSSKTDNDDGDNGLGGIFGGLACSNATDRKIVKGHNILLDNVSVVKAGGDRNPGMIVGDNYYHSLKLVGVSIQGGSSATVPVIADGGYYSEGYVVMADFDGDCKANDRNETAYPVVTNTNDLAPADPFVTFNPAENVGSSGFKLTSDGISPTVAGLPIQEIIAGDKRYANASATHASQFNLAKLSTYNTEQNTSLTDDFAVLIVDDVSRINTTNMINAYINLLANTRNTGNEAANDFDYSVNKSGVFKVDIYKMVYNDSTGKFEKSNQAANLKRDTTAKQFYMNIDSVDTAGNMFSLIDVTYYDPAQTSKIAYHLYIPVLVKKMLTFDFEIATGTGTNYERDWYDDNDRFGKPLMENLGTPASIFFRYSYIRTYDEWAGAANNGDNMFWNYPKTLTLSKSSDIPDLPGSTILVLVDAASGGKPYYARFSQVYSGGVLNLANFRTVLDDNTSQAFEPCDFIDFSALSFTAAADDNGTLIVLPAGESESNATVRAKLNGTDTLFRVANSSVQAEADAQHYTVSAVVPEGASSADVVDIVEPYYISFFTDSTTSNVVYHYTISTPATFGVASNPSRIQDSDKLLNHEGTAHLILGNIFVQSGVSLTTSPANTEISTLTGNHRVTASMSTTVQLAPALKNEVQGYLGSGSDIHVFHSFMLYLTRTDQDGSRKVITGDPTVTGTYVISSSNASVASTDTNDQLIDVHAGYAEVRSANGNQNLNDYLVNGDGAVINASVTFDYATDVAVSAQFPNREDESNTSHGTTASITSNISYDRDSTSYSKIAAPANDSTGHSYYCKIDNRTAKLHYNVISDVFVGDYGPLGINPLDDVTLEELQVSTLANYDISDIEEKAQGFDTIRCYVSLSYKVDNYGASLPIPEYMSSVTVRGYSSGDTGYTEDKTNQREYVFTLPRSEIEAASALPTSLEIPLDYTVYTGAPFEQADHIYSNYMIKLSVELIKVDTNTGTIETLTVSQADDFLIYTNARVLPDYVDPPS